MADDLTLKAVIEAVLDARGFEEFKTRLQGAAAGAQAASEQVGGLGGRSDLVGSKLERLGRNIPSAGVAIFTQNLIRASGSITGTERAVSVLSQGVGALALAMPAVGLGAGAILGGLGLLIPAIVRMREETQKLAEAIGPDEGLVGRLEQLEQKLGGLPRLLDQVLRAQRDLIDRGLREQIAAQAIELDQTLRSIQQRERNVAGLREEIEQRKALGLPLEIAVEKLAREQAALESERSSASKNSAEIAKLTALRSREIDALEAQAKAEEELNREQEKAARDARQRADEEQRRRNALETDKVRESARRQREEREARRDEERARRDRLLAAQEELVAEIDNKREINERREQFRREDLDRNIAAVQQSFALIAEAFPKNKAIAVAEALVNTFAAATLTLRSFPGPFGIALAAATVAFGLAQVAQIKAAEPAGFDLPRSDLLARKFGEKWARDFLQNVDAGFTRALGRIRSPGSGPVTSITRQTTINSGTSIGTVALGGFFGTNETELLKQLDRRLTVIRRLEKRATLR